MANWKDEMEKFSTGNDSTDKYYDMLKNQSYRELLEAENQATAARSQAEKYTKNTMNASGYGTQGIAESSGLGIANAWRNAMAGARANYDQNISGIYKDMMDTRDSNENTMINDFSESIINSTSQEGVSDLVKNFGGTIDNSGKVDFSGTSYSDRLKRILAEQADIAYKGLAPTINNDGSKTYENADGSTTTRFDSGAVMKTDADGNSVTQTTRVNQKNEQINMTSNLASSTNKKFVLNVNGTNYDLKLKENIGTNYKDFNKLNSIGIGEIVSYEGTIFTKDKDGKIWSVKDTNKGKTITYLKKILL